VRVTGIDIGSRTIKIVVLEDGRIVERRVQVNSHDPVATCRALLDGIESGRLVATGYGRHLFRQYWDCEIVTEIRAVALGARFVNPRARAILDIGGQDTKAVALTDDGAVRKFEMNDKCAAGTGRFLEVMAAALSYSMPDFVAAARSATGAQKISAMCTVFAESEIISSVARGIPREDLALGIHEGIAGRSVSLLHRVPIEDEVLFCGGVALNECMKDLVEHGLGRIVHVPEDPQIVAALGCALQGSLIE
jgi:(R)-2-hydroxyacyl-CoA dehydratese activating ATPase